MTSIVKVVELEEHSIYVNDIQGRQFPLTPHHLTPLPPLSVSIFKIQFCSYEIVTSSSFFKAQL